jgi:hypothetical protein
MQLKSISMMKIFPSLALSPLHFLLVLTFFIHLGVSWSEELRGFGNLSITLDLSDSPPGIGRLTKLLPSQLILRLQGHRYKKTRRFTEHTLEWPDIPEGNYKFALVLPPKRKLYEGEVGIKLKELTSLKIVWNGPEHGPFSRDFNGYHIVEGGRFPGLTRSHYHNWIHGRFDSSLTEIFYRGFVFWRKGGGEIGFRFDADYDLIPDEEDPDDDEDGIPDSRDRDDDGDGIFDYRDNLDPDRDEDGILNGAELQDLLLGKLQNPVIEKVKVENKFRIGESTTGQLGDLLKISASVHPAGGAKIERVVLRVFQNKKEKIRWELFDDGSLRDLDENREGRQITGDSKPDDNLYCRLIPLSADVMKKIYPSVWIIEAENSFGTHSNPWSLYLSKDGYQENLNEEILSPSIMDYSYEVELPPSGDSNGLVRIEFKAPEGSTVRKLVGSTISLLLPQRNALNISNYFDTVSVRSEELFLLTVTAPSGDVFFVGDHF